MVRIRIGDSTASRAVWLGRYHRREASSKGTKRLAALTHEYMPDGGYAVNQGITRR